MVKELPAEEVIGRYVKLERRGGSFVGRCPFHEDRTPSLSVKAAENYWHCFSCGRGGDAIAFVKEHLGVDFQQAVGEIAAANGITVEYEATGDTDSDEARRKESLYIIMKIVQDFFAARISTDSKEAAAAREYAYGRWGESFCRKSGIGYAPGNTWSLAEYCREKCIDTELLLHLGVLLKNDTGRLYPMLHGRVTIPILDRAGRVIGFTARNPDDSKPKYLNLRNSDIFTKSRVLFGINAAAREAKASGFVIAVEGAPDVLRLQSVGLMNCVAALGTAWSDSHFEALAKLTRAICFIPDTDLPTEDEPFGAGFKAVMHNGAEAMRRGFDVTVRELPPGDKDGHCTKNDPDSHIKTKEDFYCLVEKHFVVWLAEKRFMYARTMADEKSAVAEIAGLMALSDDGIAADDCITKLSAIYGDPGMWASALSRAKADTQSAENGRNTPGRPTMTGLMKKHNLFVKDNMYYSAGGDQPLRLSNFIMEPMYHIKDARNGTRIFRLINEYGNSEVVEFREAELVSITTFQQKLGSIGCYIWKGRIDKLNSVKELLYSMTDTAEYVGQMGWNAEHGFYAFGNGILKDGSFLAVDDMGIVRTDDRHKYYLPATSRMYRHNPTAYQFERMFLHENRSSISLHDFSQRVIDVFGNNGKIGICFLLASLFRDLVYPIKNCFPILNLFGLKGTGKTSLATTLQSFFIHGYDPPSISNSSIPSMNDRVSQVTNAMVVLDEYKNDLDERKIAYLKALWGGTGQVKKNVNGDGKTGNTIVTAAVCMCGQDLPTRDIALYSRVIHLTFTRPSFSNEERRRFDDLKEMSNLGNTHLAIEVLNRRWAMEKRYRPTHSLVRKELAMALCDEEIEDRILDNWVVPLAVFRTLEPELDLPMTYHDLFSITVDGIRYQNEGCRKSTEMAEFWEIIDSLHSQGRIIDKAHFNIKYLTSFRAINSPEAMEFGKAKPILFLNTAAVSSIYASRVIGGGSRSSNWATVMTYLKVQPSYLGLKQDRFNLLLPNGSFDYTIDGHVKKIKVNRPKALCFDYTMLKDKYSINLESAVEVENEDNTLFPEK